MALSIASPGKATVSSPSQYLTFELGDEMFAVGTLNVREIIEYGPITSVPLLPPSIRGVINLRGAAVPVLDLGVRFRGERTVQTSRTCFVILEVQANAGASRWASLWMRSARSLKSPIRISNRP